MIYTYSQQAATWTGVRVRHPERSARRTRGPTPDHIHPPILPLTHGRPDGVTVYTRAESTRTKQLL